MASYLHDHIAVGIRRAFKAAAIVGAVVLAIGWLVLAIALLKLAIAYLMTGSV